MGCKTNFKITTKSRLLLPAQNASAIPKNSKLPNEIVTSAGLIGTPRRRDDRMEADSPTTADVAGASDLLFLADSSPASPPSPPAPDLSDEFSCHSGSSTSSGPSASSCVSYSALRGRPVDPLRVLSVVASLRRFDPKVLAKATATVLPCAAGRKRKCVWIDIDSGGGDNDENSSAVASEGSTVTGVASAGEMPPPSAAKLREASGEEGCDHAVTVAAACCTGHGNGHPLRDEQGAALVAG